jgi:hypothetical protein
MIFTYAVFLILDFIFYFFTSCLLFALCTNQFYAGSLCTTYTVLMTVYSCMFYTSFVNVARNIHTTSSVPLAVLSVALPESLPPGHSHHAWTASLVVEPHRRRLRYTVWIKLNAFQCKAGCVMDSILSNPLHCAHHSPRHARRYRL